MVTVERAERRRGGVRGGPSGRGLVLKGRGPAGGAEGSVPKRCWAGNPQGLSRLAVGPRDTAPAPTSSVVLTAVALPPRVRTSLVGCRVTRKNPNWGWLAGSFTNPSFYTNAFLLNCNKYPQDLPLVTFNAFTVLWKH